MSDVSKFTFDELRILQYVSFKERDLKNADGTPALNDEQQSKFNRILIKIKAGIESSDEYKNKIITENIEKLSKKKKGSLELEPVSEENKRSLKSYIKGDLFDNKAIVQSIVKLCAGTLEVKYLKANGKETTVRKIQPLSVEDGKYLWVYSLKDKIVKKFLLDGIQTVTILSYDRENL